MRTIPLLLSLPDGPARLVPGSFEQGRPRYERDGAPLDVDVTIPDDLQVFGEDAADALGVAMCGAGRVEVVG